jgi:ribose 5-phosphate isomerase B
LKKIFLASDHAGHELKDKIKKHLILKSSELRIEVIDLGPDTTESVDYPDFADRLCHSISEVYLVGASQPKQLQQMGILICGSGQGMAMRANKFSHIRAALVWSKESVLLSRQHNNANVLCLGSRLLVDTDAIGYCELFIQEDFGGERHQRRVDQLSRATVKTNS